MREVGERDNMATGAIDDGTQVMLGNMPCVENERA
jgi:hypothetical protein